MVWYYIIIILMEKFIDPSVCILFIRLTFWIETNTFTRDDLCRRKRNRRPSFWLFLRGRCNQMKFNPSMRQLIAVRSPWTIIIGTNLIETETDGDGVKYSLNKHFIVFYLIKVYIHICIFRSVSLVTSFPLAASLARFTLFYFLFRWYISLHQNIAYAISDNKRKKNYYYS